MKKIITTFKDFKIEHTLGKQKGVNIYWQDGQKSSVTFDTVLQAKKHIVWLNESLANHTFVREKRVNKRHQFSIADLFTPTDIHDELNFNHDERL